MLLMPEPGAEGAVGSGGGTTTYNPIVSFTYDQNNNQYTTLLKDGQPGPTVSLNELFTIKELVVIENQINGFLSQSTEIQTNCNKLTTTINKIKQDLTDNYEPVRSQITLLKNKVKGL